MENTQTLFEKPALVVKRSFQAAMRHQNKPVLQLDIAYPQLSAAGAAAASINGFYRQRAQELFTRARREMYDGAVQAFEECRREGKPFCPHTASAAYEVPCNRDGLLSVFTDVYRYTGGAHGGLGRVSQTFSLLTGKRIPLPALFYGAGYRACLCREVMEQITFKISAGEAYSEDWGKKVFEFFDDRNYYITPGALALYFPPCSLAPYEAGIPVFSVPFEKLAGLRLTRGALQATLPDTGRLP